MTNSPTRYSTPEVHTIGEQTSRHGSAAQETWVPFRDTPELALTAIATALVGVGAAAAGFPLWLGLVCLTLTVGWGVAFHCALTRPRVRRVLFVVTSGLCVLLALLALLGAAVLFQSNKPEVEWGLVAVRVAMGACYIWFARVAFQARRDPRRRDRSATPTENAPA